MIWLSFIVVTALTTYITAFGKIQVHIVGHSHDDPGWLKTVDQYYTGSNASIYPANVQYIFDSVIDELNHDKERKFTFCEISFFARWWNEQDSDTRSNVKDLVNNGQLGFVNGGWVMHDEASAHYVSMIDQTTLGHQFLKKELNYKPRVGWQVDPFGHSKTHAWLSSEVGFDALFFGRIDYQDHNKRMAEKSMEMVWRGSSSSPDAQVFTGAFSDGNYGPPDGFCFDTSCFYCRSDPVVDDPALDTFNIDAKAQRLIDAIIEEHSHHLGNNIMLKLGSDFTWDNARTWFKSLDKIIKRVNAQDSRFNLFYSDPTTYMRARAEEVDVVWPAKTDDFFPYSDCEHCFWTGYFTSRPTLKYVERVAASYLQVLKQMGALPQLAGTDAAREAEKVVQQLTAAVGLVNHHDAITGTSKQHVADDYMKIISKALTAAEAVTSAVVARGLAAQSASEPVAVSVSVSVCRLVNETVCSATQALAVGDVARVVVYNPLARARSQQVTVFLSEMAGAADVQVQVFAVTPAPQSATTKNVTHNQSEDVSKYIKDSVVADVFPTAGTSPNKDAAAFGLVFTASNVPPLGFSEYQVHITSTDTNINTIKGKVTPTSEKAEATKVSKKGVAQAVEVTHPVEGAIKVVSDLVAVTFDATTGLMQSITRLDTGVTADVTSDLRYYKSFGSAGLRGEGVHAEEDVVVDDRDPHLKNLKPAAHHVGATSAQPSGAYLFRPSTADEKPVTLNGAGATLTILSGRNVVEVRQVFRGCDWATQVVRVRQGSPAVEIEWTVGPIPTRDSIGKEVVHHIQSSLSSGPQGANIVYTDANGREFLPRQLNYRETWDMEVFEPVAGNFYPLTTGMFIKDPAAGLQLSVLTDRAQAGGSLASGEMELMVHRRLLRDDNRGVGEPLDETVGGMIPPFDGVRIGEGITVSGKHYLILSTEEAGVREMRTMMDELFAPLATFYSPIPTHSTSSSTSSSDIDRAPLLSVASALGSALPSNVQLVTLERFSANKLLVRLGHQFAVGEDATLSLPVEVDLASLLSPLGPVSAEEYTLSANQLRSEREGEKVRWQSVLSTSAKGKEVRERAVVKATQVSGAKMVVTLEPLEIRTFIVTTK